MAFTQFLKEYIWQIKRFSARNASTSARGLPLLVKESLAPKTFSPGEPLSIFNTLISKPSSTNVGKNAKLSSTTGFSIVETLVAIAIITITIAGSLTAVNKSLAVSTETRNQTTASLLAQDAMEYIKNVKSLNIKVNAPSWLFGLGSCVEGDPCIVDSMFPNGSGVSSCLPSGGCPVYVNSIGYHQTITGDSVRTPFDRSFYLGPVGSDERKIVVNVTWETAGVPDSAKLVNYIFNVAW